jgi:hypothetical protein
MSGYIVEVFESNDATSPSLWLSEADGVWSTVRSRGQSAIFPTAKEALIAANDYQVAQPDKAVHYAIRPQ